MPNPAMTSRSKGQLKSTCNKVMKKDVNISYEGRIQSDNQSQNCFTILDSRIQPDWMKTHLFLRQNQKCHSFIILQQKSNNKNRCHKFPNANAVVLILFAVAGQLFLSQGHTLPAQACWLSDPYYMECY